MGYGRIKSDLTELPDQARQTTALITCTENAFTKPIDDPVKYPDDYRAPLPCETRTFELTGYKPTGNAGRFQIADFIQENLDNLEIPFDDMLRNLCDAWNYGYKLAEKIYYIKEGRYYLKVIKNKPSKVIRFIVDDFSNLISCQ